MTRRRKLDELEAGRLVADYELGRQNRPKKLAAKYGVSKETIRAYVRRAQRRLTDGHAA